MQNFVAVGQTVAEMATAAIFEFLNFEILRVGRVKWIKMHHDAKFCAVPFFDTRILIM